MKLKVIIGICLLLIVFAVSCQNEEQLEFTHYYSSGKLTYQAKCQNCHGANGEGLHGLIPPLTDSAYLKLNKATLACAIKYGLKGKLSISNRSYEGEMPASDLAPVDIAGVLTYVTNSFTNKMGLVTSQQVEIDLAKCK
jgi:mono/diheme cytochrome c family protein